MTTLGRLMVEFLAQIPDRRRARGRRHRLVTILLLACAAVQPQPQRGEDGCHLLAQFLGVLPARRSPWSACLP